MSIKRYKLFIPFNYLFYVQEKVMSKISPMQAAALGLIPSQTITETIAPKPNTTQAVAIKAKVVKTNIAKPVTKAPPAVKAVIKTVAKPIVKTALKPAPKAIRSVNIKQDYKKIDHKKNDLHKDNQKNNHKKNDKKDDKNLRPEKIKMERDSFTMPKDEYAQLTLLKARLMAMGQPAKKSELLRAGIKLLAAMSDNTLKTTLAKIPVIKTGRPNK